MIGQLNNKQLIEKWRRDNSFPRFLIITGEEGSGKSTMSRFIAKKGIGGYIVTPGNKVDEVREAIENAYKCTSPTVYIFYNTDKMSVQAKNALLKVTEEPPRKAYFIITVQDVNNTLTTLKSRGTELKMEPYTIEELSHFTDDEEILSIASTPGQVEKLQQIGVNEFKEFCNKVLNNIGSVTGVNAFKIGNSFKFKDDGEGYDVNLFFNCIQSICTSRLWHSIGKTSFGLADCKKYYKTMICCSKYKQEFNITGVKKDSTFDMWILEMRDIWR